MSWKVRRMQHATTVRQPVIPSKYSSTRLTARRCVTGQGNMVGRSSSSPGDGPAQKSVRRTSRDVVLDRDALDAGHSETAWMGRSSIVCVERRRNRRNRFRPSRGTHDPAPKSPIDAGVDSTDFLAPSRIRYTYTLQHYRLPQLVSPHTSGLPSWLPSSSTTYPPSDPDVTTLRAWMGWCWDVNR